MQKRIITYPEYGELVDELVDLVKTTKFDCIYGIPRGGLPIAVHLSHHTNKSLIDYELVPWDFYIDKKLLIVDDIIDTGLSLDSILQLFRNHVVDVTVATLFKRPSINMKDHIFVEESSEWIVFPWELLDEEPSEYHQGIYPDLVKERKPNVL